MHIDTKTLTRYWTIMNYGRPIFLFCSYAVDDGPVTKPRAETKTRADWILDNGYLPHAVIRMGIRRQLRQRLVDISSASLSAAFEAKIAFIERLRTRPIAVETDAANSQHYEVGTGVLKACLGPRMKYSSCLYPKGVETLAQAEVAMLQTYLEKAELKDGMSILDLG